MYGRQGPVARPATLMIASVMSWISFGLGALGGFFLVVVSGRATTVFDEDGYEGSLSDDVAWGAAVVGLVIVFLAVVSIAFSVFAFKGKLWATICLTVEGVLFLLVCVVGMIGSPGGGTALGSLIMIAWVGAALALYWVSPSQTYYRSRR